MRRWGSDDSFAARGHTHAPVLTVNPLQELEAKYLVVGDEPAGRVLMRLQQSLAWAGIRIAPAGRRDLVDTYLDTPDQQLRTAGWSYRRRSGDGHVSLTLKEIARPRAAIFDRAGVTQSVSAEHTDLARPPPGPDPWKRVTPTAPFCPAGAQWIWAATTFSILATISL